MSTPSPSIQYRLFVGCRLTSDFKRQLEKHPEWKNFSLGLKEIYHQNQEFIGIHLSETLPTLKQLQSVEKEIETLLSSCCSDLNPERFKCIVFPQLFIS